MRASLRAALTAAAAATMLAVLPGLAHATPPSGLSSVILSQRTVGGKDYIVRELTLQPGGSTGWHYHDGTRYVLVRQGTLTHNDSQCATDGVYPAGATFTETSGAGHVHIGRNLGTVPVVLDVLSEDPTGTPVAEDAPNPGCPFQ